MDTQAATRIKAEMTMAHILSTKSNKTAMTSLSLPPKSSTIHGVKKPWQLLDRMEPSSLQNKRKRTLR